MRQGGFQTFHREEARRPETARHSGRSQCVPRFRGGDRELTGGSREARGGQCRAQEVELGPAGMRSGPQPNAEEATVLHLSICLSTGGHLIG